jgi:hypothetical protein
MPPAISKETAKTLADTIGMVKLIDQQNKKIQPRFKKMAEGLKAGIDGGSEDEIALYRPQLGKVVEEIDDCLNTVQGAQGLMAQLRKDDVLMETKFEQIEKLVKTVSATRKTLAEQAVAARKLDDAADKGLDEAKGSALSMEADLAALKDQVADLMKTITFIETEAPKLEATARKAFDGRDQKTLTEARVKLIEFLKYGTAATLMRPRIDKFVKKYPKLDREQKAQAQWLLDDLQRAESSVKDVDKVVKELVGLGQVQKINAAQAAKTLGLKDAADQAELKRILDSNPKDLAKALDPLAKKNKSTGKAWADKL